MESKTCLSLSVCECLWMCQWISAWKTELKKGVLDNWNHTHIETETERETAHTQTQMWMHHTTTPTTNCETEKMVKMWSNKSYLLFTWKFIFIYHMSHHLLISKVAKNDCVVVVVDSTRSRIVLWTTIIITRTTKKKKETETTTAKLVSRMVSHEWKRARWAWCVCDKSERDTHTHPPHMVSVWIFTERRRNMREKRWINCTRTGYIRIFRSGWHRCCWLDSHFRCLSACGRTVDIRELVHSSAPPMWYCIDHDDCWVLAVKIKWIIIIIIAPFMLSFRSSFNLKFSFFAVHFCELLVQNKSICMHIRVYSYTNRIKCANRRNSTESKWCTILAQVIWRLACIISQIVVGDISNGERVSIAATL